MCGTAIKWPVVLVSNGPPEGASSHEANFPVSADLTLTKSSGNSAYITNTMVAECEASTPLKPEPITGHDSEAIPLAMSKDCPTKVNVSVNLPFLSRHSK
jgi:hypothetical protein